MTNPRVTGLPSWATKMHLDVIRSSARRRPAQAKYWRVVGNGYDAGVSATEEDARRQARRAANAQARASGGSPPWIAAGLLW